MMAFTQPAGWFSVPSMAGTGPVIKKDVKKDTREVTGSLVSFSFWCFSNFIGEAAL